MCVYHLLFLFYILMASVWNVITLDGSFSCRSCPGLVRCSDYQPPQTILTCWIESTSVSLQQKVNIDRLLAMDILGWGSLCLSDGFKLSPSPLWLGMTLWFHALSVFISVNILCEFQSLDCGLISCTRIWDSKKYLKTCHEWYQINETPDW